VSLDDDPGEDAFWEDDEEEPSKAGPRSRWSTAAEVLGGLLALFLVSVAVWVLYLAVGVGFAVAGHLVTTAAPAIAAVTAALILARYLSRR
jgi:hypothetical protein